MCFYLHNVIASWDKEEMYLYGIQICTTVPSAY